MDSLRNPIQNCLDLEMLMTFNEFYDFTELMKIVQVLSFSEVRSILISYEKADPNQKL